MRRSQFARRSSTTRLAALTLGLAVASLALAQTALAQTALADHHEAAEAAAQQVEKGADGAKASAEKAAGAAGNKAKAAAKEGQKQADRAEARAKAKAARAERLKNPLYNPNLAKAQAPERFKVKLETTKGDIVLDVTRAWSPNGVDRFYNLVKIGYYEDIAFFRVIDGFMAQFGMHGDPQVMRAWQRATIRDDPVVESNKRGYVSFAKTGAPNSRSVQLFINLSDNPNLDGMRFSPFARVVEGMDVVDQIYKVGEGKPRGPGPAQNMIQRKGNAYLRQAYPKLDYLKKATLLD